MALSIRGVALLKHYIAISIGADIPTPKDRQEKTTPTRMSNKAGVVGDNLLINPLQLDQTKQARNRLGHAPLPSPKRTKIHTQLLYERNAHHFETLFALATRRLHGELRTKDVAEFGPISVSTSSDFALVVVVVGRGEQSAKDKLRDIHLLHRMHDHRNPTPIIPHTNRVALTANTHIHTAE